MSPARSLVFTPYLAPADADSLSAPASSGNSCEPFAIVSESPGASRMTYLSALPEDGTISILAMLITSARRWREARDMGLPVQPHLFTGLAPEGGGILAPVIDSLMHLYEIVLHRPVRVGHDGRVSLDEELLLDLLTGAKQSRDSFSNSGGMGRVFETALASTRIMVCKAFRLPAIV